MSPSTTTNDVPLRVGVVGLGYTGEQHILGYQALPGVEVVALAGLEEPRLAQLGADYSIPHLYLQYQELLERDDLDLVSVCTPNAMHAPVATAALESGRHVLCEKPLARTAAEASTMVAAATAQNRVLRTVFNNRFRGDAVAITQLLGQGAFGDIYHAKASWMRRAGIPSSIGGWFTNREIAGGGPLIDLGVHVLDLALHFMGEPTPVTVSAATYSELGPRGRGASAQGGDRVQGSTFDVEDLATAFIRFAGGATLLLEASWAHYGKLKDDFGVTLLGTEGGAEMLVSEYADEGTLQIFSDVAGVPAVTAPRTRAGLGHRQVVADFVEVVRGGEWSAYHGEDGLLRARIIDACYESARTGREIVL